MKFDSLEKKCLYYRGLTDYKLMGNEYMIIMLDGHTFSKKIKNSFKLPFDDDFIRMMNITAKYVCQNIQGAKFAFVQSDEISILVTDFDTPETDSFFGNRLCKIQSIVASMASTKFTALALEREYKLSQEEDKTNLVEDAKLYEFDCKAWVVPNKNDAFAWFLYRQNDCIRNSKSQAAQAYFSHKELEGLSTDRQIAKLYSEKDINWNDYEEGKKFGRVIKKVQETFFSEQSYKNYNRMVWNSYPCPVLNDVNQREKFLEIIPEDGSHETSGNVIDQLKLNPPQPIKTFYRIDKD